MAKDRKMLGGFELQPLVILIIYYNCINYPNPNDILVGLDHESFYYTTMYSVLCFLIRSHPLVKFL